MSEERTLAEALAQRDLHNRLAGDIVQAMIEPIRDSGGTPADVLVLLESIIAGIVLIIAEETDDEEVLEVLFERLRERLPALRRRGPPPSVN